MAYDHRMVAWADTRFAHRFAGGTVPEKPAGRRYTRQCWAGVLRTLGAALIAAITWWVDGPARTAALAAWHATLGIVVVIESIRALSYTIWPRRAAEPLVGGTGRPPRHRPLPDSNRAVRRRAGSSRRPAGTCTKADCLQLQLTGCRV